MLLPRMLHAVVLLADRDSEMLEELRRNGAEQIDLLIVESYAPLQAEGTLELLREYPPLPDCGIRTAAGSDQLSRSGP